MAYSLGHTAQKNTFKCTKGKFLHKPPNTSLCTPMRFPGKKEKRKGKNFLSLHFTFTLQRRRTSVEPEPAVSVCGWRPFFHANHLQEVAQQNAASCICIPVSRASHLFSLPLGGMVYQEETEPGWLHLQVFFQSSYSWEHCSFNKLLRAMP